MCLPSQYANMVSRSVGRRIQSSLYVPSSLLSMVANCFVVMLLALQSMVCLVSLLAGKNFRAISFRDFNIEEARKCTQVSETKTTNFRIGSPISFLLVLMIFTSAKALQYISIPTYTIFKNLTIILIAYGEVLWFGGSVTGLALLSFGLMVLSSVVSAWADISSAISNYSSAPHEAATELASLNAGYIWMLLNCLSSATFVLSMRKRIKLTQFSDFDSIPKQLRFRANWIGNVLQ